MKKFYSLILLCATFCTAFAQKKADPEIAAMRQLVKRVVPEYSKNITLEALAPDTVDRFELESKGKKLVIRGNNANSMAVGLNHYLGERFRPL